MIQLKKHDFQKYFDKSDTHKAIITAHPTRSPSTYTLNLVNYTTDGLWCSISIKPVRAGYSRFGMGILSDNRTV